MPFDVVGLLLLCSLTASTSELCKMLELSMTGLIVLRG